MFKWLNKDLPVKAVLATISVVGFFATIMIGMWVMSAEGQLQPSDVFALTNLALAPVAAAFGYFYGKGGNGDGGKDDE